MTELVDNTEERRFELQTSAGIALSEYVLRGDVLEIRHTEVPPELEGQGIGSRLIRGVLDIARARGLKVVPRCPFAAAYMRRHPEYDDLRA